MFGMKSVLLVVNILLTCASPAAFGDQCLRLSSVYVENPRFASLETAQLDLALRRAEIDFQKYFNRCIQISPPEPMTVNEAFGHLSLEQREAAEAQIVHRPDAEDLASLSAQLQEAVLKDGSLQEQIAFIDQNPAIKIPRNANAKQIADKVVQYQASVMKAYLSQLDQRGEPIIGSQPFNEFMYWLLLPKTDLRYDLYLTNQPIVSMERNSPSIHTAIRGGLSNGVTTPCAKCDFGMASVVSVYAVYGEDSILRLMRKERAYSNLERQEYVAELVTHELGHQLLHFGHPYGSEACVMDPVEGLNFSARDLGLTKGGCADSHSPAMQVGALNIKDIPVPFERFQ